MISDEDIKKEMKKDYSYPLPDDLNFQNKIYKKREFYYNKILPRDILTDYKDIKNFRDEKCGSSFELRTQQTLLSNFINPDTPYKGLLIYHGVGTGKTCAAITIAENFKDQVRKYDTKIYILVSGPLIRENWKDDLIKCTKETYLKELNTTSGYINNIEYKKSIKQAKLLTNQYYKIMSYRSFYKKVLGQKIIEQKIGEIKKYKKNIQGEYERELSINKIDSLDNTLLIIDEAHNLTDNDQGNALKKIISKSKNLKILLLTATPMINFADEIIELLNYLRPYNDPIIRDLVFTSDRTHTMEYKKNGKKYLSKMANGYVSHYRGMDPLTFADIEEQGEIPKELYFTKLCRCYMLEFQLETYLTIVNTVDDSLDRKSQAVSNFCFPGLSNDKKSIIGYSGKDGLDIIKSQLIDNKLQLQQLINSKFFDNKLDNSNIIKIIDKIKPITGSILKKDNLKYFSIKYYNVLINLEKLVVDKNGCGTAFIYFNLVKIGIELFAEILLANGYLEFNEEKNYNINDNTIDAITGLTYEKYINDNKDINNFYPATFMTITGNEDAIEQYLEMKKKILDSVFNDIDNKDGRHIKFILGSKVMTEGTNLENVAEVHIVDVYYNLSKVHQVIGRAVRQCKHYKIINDDNKFPKVKIYKYVVSLKDRLSTEEQMYKKAELKYILIKDTERLLKKVAFDCPINYNGNVFPEEILKFKKCVSARDLIKNNNHDNKLICPSQCDLQKCLFKCFNKKLNLKYYDSTKNIYKQISKNKLDFTTFTYSLAKNEIDNIKEKIKELYKFKYVYTLDECINYIKKKYYFNKYDLFEDFFVYKALDKLIPINENDFNNFIDTIYDKFNIPGYLIYRYKFYIFQPFEQNENIPMYYRTIFHSNLFNSLSIYNYLKSLDILTIINNTNNTNENTFISSNYNFKDVIEYYETKKEYKYVGILDKSSIKKRLTEEHIPDIFKLRVSRNISSNKKRAIGIPNIKGAVCYTAKKKIELINIAKTLRINIENNYDYDSRYGLCDLIKYRLLFLEKYSTNEDNNKYTYFIIPINHPVYKFPLNLQDRVSYILDKLSTKIPIKITYNIIKSNNGIFENTRDNSLVRYILIIDNNTNIMKYDKVLKILCFSYNETNNKWEQIIE